jgi:2-polyprenyl-3-methyl-5-hydroxy-6-metoxy-1,4-benzoquinol methylase
MRFRETPVGRVVHRLPAGDLLLNAGGKAVGLVYRLRSLNEKRKRVATTKRNIQNAYKATGIEYRPVEGFGAFYHEGPLDVWFTAKFPDGEELRLHVTRERGYRDVSGLEHLPLYERFASELLTTVPGGSGRILDCACGTGYGADFLQRELQCRVIGVDIEEEAIRYAQKRYAAPSVAFQQGSATNLDFIPSGSLNAVVSIETIEHIPDDRVAIAEFRRVLDPNGVLLISTPDATQRPGTIISPFHEREYTRSEFQALLGGAFRSIEIRPHHNERDDLLLAICRP